MSPDQIVTVIVAIVAAIGGTSATAMFARRKTKAETEGTIVATATQAAKELIFEYKAQADKIQKDNLSLRADIEDFRARLIAKTQQIKEQQNEIRLLGNAIENVNAQVLKYRFIISIFSMQFRLMGQEPLIHPDNIDGISLDELQTIAASMSNVIRRRDEALNER